MRAFFALLVVVRTMAGPNPAPFPEPASKKGLQVQMVKDALELGIKHAALNVNLAQMLDLPARENSIPFQSSGRAFHFSSGYMEGMDARVKELSDHGIVVSLILLYYQSGREPLDRVMLHPHYDPAAPNKLTAFNVTTEEGRAFYRACIEFLAQRYSRPDAQHGQVWNYIVGNEVNSHWFWSNMGRVTMEEFAEDYLKAVRITHEAVRKFSEHARVYISLEHHWNIRYPGGDEKQAFAGKGFIDYFARRARAEGDFDWHIAFHPYPENLFECRTWLDKSALPHAETPRITFKNLSVLTEYLKREPLLHQGKPRRVILSEQGFHSPPGAEGEKIQAAAYCYAWVKVQQLDGIDSFILHRHVDHGQEGGLNLGLWTRDPKAKHPAEPAAKKMIYDVFRLADTPEWRKAFEFALPVIGITSWDEVNRQ